jgi:inhibitor of KinA
MYHKINKWSVYSLGDHAIVFALEEKIDPFIVHTITRLSDFIKSKGLPGVKDIIPSYHTLTLVYDIIQFSNTSKNTTDYLVAFSNHILNEFDLIPTTSLIESKEIIAVPVCYEMPFAMDIESLSKAKNISTDVLIQIHTSKIYEVYSIGFLPGFAYMGTVDEKIQMPRHEKPRMQVIAGSVGIAGLQTGIYPSDSPGGWQIIGRTPWKIFDPNPSVLAKFKVGDKIQYYSISKNDFDKMNEHN